MKFNQIQLENGLTIIAEASEAARSLALGFFVRTGARDETPDVSGVSHYLEHMLFKGTERRSAFDVNLEFDRMGAKYNAFTSEENTVFYAVVLPEYQAPILDLWADLMRPALRDEDFNTEKGVILEEIAMYKDLPHFDVQDRARKLHYGEHPSGNSVLGSIESITALSAAQMRQYFAARYSADNLVLACAGKVDWPRLVEQARQLCSSWKPARPTRELKDFPGTGRIETYRQEKVQRQHICLISAAPSEQHPLRYAASVLASIIGDDTNSRYYWALVDNALADTADMDYDSQDGTGAFYSYVSCDPELAGKVVGIVRAELARMRKEGVTEAELDAAKNKIASSATLHGELPMGRLVPLGFGWQYRREYVPLAREIAAITAVTAADICQLMEAYPLEPLTIQGLGPLEKI